MKSSPALYIAMSTLLCAVLSACGQTGPLYMPKQPPKPAPAAPLESRPGVAPPAAPVPSTPPVSQQPAMPTSTTPQALPKQ